MDFFLFRLAGSRPPAVDTLRAALQRQPFFVRAPRRLRQAATTFRGLDGWLYRLLQPAAST